MNHSCSHHKLQQIALYQKVINYVNWVQFEERRAETTTIWCKIDIYWLWVCCGLHQSLSIIINLLVINYKSIDGGLGRGGVRGLPWNSTSPLRRPKLVAIFRMTNVKTEINEIHKRLCWGWGGCVEGERGREGEKRVLLLPLMINGRIPFEQRLWPKPVSQNLCTPSSIPRKCS